MRHVLDGDPPVALLLRRSARARRISLRVSRLDGRVTLTLPPGVPEREALAFALDRADWIRGHLGDMTPSVAVAPGTDLPVEGRPRRIEAAVGRRILLDENRIAVPGDPIGPRLQAFLKARARDRLAAASDRHAAALGLPYARLSLRDPRSRWGSCSSRGTLMYSWRLILAPPEVLDYVCAHEVAHLAEMNHSDRFWQVVRRLYGPFEAERRWLRNEGGALHRFVFTA